MKMIVKQLGVIASLVLLGEAAPAVFRRDVDSTVLGNMDLFAQYSAAAYCAENRDSSSTSIACSVGNCPLVEAADTIILDEFDQSATFGDVTGFIAADTTNSLIVLSFRGSSDLSNWIADIDFGLTSISDICSGCEAHSGFWEAWNTAADTITSIVESAVTKYPDYEIVFTGHSYGAALAAVAATVFRNDGYTVQLYNYGQPRIGNLALAEYITDQSSGSNYRTTHTDDIVPKLPPELLGYHHFSPEYWITSGDNVTVTTSDVSVVTGIDSTDGNDGTTADSVTAHRWYFVYISECS